MISQADIARTAGVSLATVSLALNRHPRVAERTRVRIMAIAERLGYLPDFSARHLARSRFGGPRTMDRVGLAIFWSNQDYLVSYLPYLCGAEAHVARQGGTLLFARVEDEARKARIQALARTAAVDGWLAMGGMDEKTVAFLRSIRCPFVILGDHAAAGPVNNVRIDFPAVGRMAAQRLAAAGHRRLVFLSPDGPYLFLREMREGFRAEAGSLGLACDEAMQPAGQGKREPDEALVKQALAGQAATTGLLVAEPGWANRVWDLVRRIRGVREPLPGLVCIENQGTQLPPAPIACLVLPAVDVGAEGVRLLQDLGAQPESAPRQILMAPAWAATEPQARGAGGV